MTRVTVRIEGHYEVVEDPFSRSYKWHPASITLVCDCGEELTLTGVSTAPTCCRCGADHSALINDIQEREAQLGHAVTTPGAMRGENRQNNTYETKLLTLRAPPDATTMLRRA